MAEAELKSNEINEEILKCILFIAPSLNLFASDFLSIHWTKLKTPEGMKVNKRQAQVHSLGYSLMAQWTKGRTLYQPIRSSDKYVTNQWNFWILDSRLVKNGFLFQRWTIFHLQFIVIRLYHLISKKKTLSLRRLTNFFWYNSYK